MMEVDGSVVIEKYQLKGTHYFHWEWNMCCPVQTGSHNTAPHQYCRQRKSKVGSSNPIKPSSAVTEDCKLVVTCKMQNRNAIDKLNQ